MITSRFPLTLPIFYTLFPYPEFPRVSPLGNSQTLPLALEGRALARIRGGMRYQSYKQACCMRVYESEPPANAGLQWAFRLLTGTIPTGTGTILTNHGWDNFFEVIE